MTGSKGNSSSPSITKRLPDSVDELSRDFPNNTFLTIPHDGDLSRGWRNISYREVAQAVDGMCTWLEENFGVGTRNVDVAAYIGINDARYAVTEVGLMKAGYKALLPSPRISQEGQASLFKTTKCNLLLHSEGVKAHVDAVKTALPEMRHH